MSQNIEEKLEKIVSNRNIYRTGRVTRINSFVVETSGLDDVFYFEKVYIGTENNIGYVDKIEPNKVYISVVQEKDPIKIGDNVLSTKEPLMSYFSEECMGMIVDMFGSDKLTGKPFNNSRTIMIETPKIGIMERTSVNRPLETGIAAIDMLYPIGRGQRQLIIGDKKIGKTQIALDTIVNQRDKDMICIYIAIGKTKKEIKAVYTKLIERGANAYTIIVSAFNDDPVPVLKLTPYVGMSMAEEFLKEGKDVLVVIDDLKKHADACREISLIANKNTGRDAYPADIFYTHSRLLEKGCQHKNGGSITVLPIIETKGNDITDYISTNVISITDGQIVLSPKLFEKGQKPAIDYGLSVSRLGSAVQREEIVEVGSTIRKTLLSYLETAEVYELVNEETMTLELKHQLKVGKKILQMLKQPKFTPLSASDLASRFEFIFTSGSEEDNQQEIPSQTMEEIIPMPNGLNEALKSEQTDSVVFEDLPENNNGSSYNLVSPAPIVDAPVVIEDKPVTFDIPAVEIPNAENEVVTSPVVDAPIVDAPIVESPIVDAPVVIEDKPVTFDIPAEEIPNAESEVITSPVVDAPVVDTPIVESPIVDAPVVIEDKPVTFDIPTEEIPNAENEVVAPPVVDTPTVDTPIVESPIVDAPVVIEDKPVTFDIPAEEIPNAESEVITSPVVDAPVVDTPIVESPIVDTPQEQPAMEEFKIEEEIPIEMPDDEMPELPQMEEVIIENTPVDIDIDDDDIDLPITSESLIEVEDTDEDIELPKFTPQVEIDDDDNIELPMPSNKSE